MEHSGEGVNDCVAGASFAALLETCVIVNADPCSCGDLFPPQAGYAAPVVPVAGGGLQVGVTAPGPKEFSKLAGQGKPPRDPPGEWVQGS